MNPSFPVKFGGLLILGIITTFVVDPLDPSTISTPFMLGIVLMGLSLRQSVSLVLATSVSYCILTIYALVEARSYYDAHIHLTPHPYFWLFQRLGLFLVVCGLAIYLAHYRTGSQKILEHVQNILTKLPAPVIISDAAGYIVYANEALCGAFQQDSIELMGKRYVDFLMTDIQEGKAMRYYIELFGAETNSVHDIEVRPFDSDHTTKARLTCLGTGPNRVMITVISNGLSQT